jgi:serine/threonine protein kinase/tetratricopeptide (TPR) repeat protein
MTGPTEKDDAMLRAMLADGADGSALADPDIGEAFAVYQKVEALFDWLRRPASTAEAHADLSPGKLLADFRILRPLAAGGMGQVYLARQESLGRLVALKVCRPEMVRDPRMKSRFMAEGVSLARLSHPNVVPVLSTGEDSGYLYLAMEYVAGPTLAQVLQAIQAARPDTLASTVVALVLASPEGHEQTQPWGETHARLDRGYHTWVVQKLQRVAQGLAAVHQAGILHRDIKPANIVFAANGVPKIVDFGLARTERAPSTTVMGEFYGTPAYASPEQARGDVETVSPASDVFSFGVTLFECLSLARPFPGRTSADVLSAVLNSDPPLLRRVEKRIPYELEAITDKCLRKKPAERYPSAQALADDLRNFLELRPVSARRTSTIRRVGRMVRRRPWVAAFVFTLVSAMLLGGFLAQRAWADYRAEQVKTVAKRVDEGDVALFRCLTGQRPTWLPAVIEQYRQQGIAAYTAALEYGPDAVRPLVQRARLYASTKETLDLALADLERAQQLQPAFASIRRFRGFVLDELGRKEEGKAAQEEAKGLYPTNADDLYWLGVIAHSREQDFVASYDYFSRALLLAPNDYWSRLERAYFGRIPSEGNGTAKRVVPELQVAKTLRPDLPFASELLGHFYSRDPLRRKKELEDQIERFGLDILRAHQMSEELQKEKKYDEAQVLLHRVLERDTGGLTAEQIGDLEYRLGHYELARDWYRRAISEGTKYPIAYLHLANALTALQDWKNAEGAYLDGIAEYPKEASLYWNLGSWYQARYRIADAEQIYKKGCDLPDEVEGSPRSALQKGDVATCYRKLAFLLGEVCRTAECVQVLQSGIARLQKGRGNSIASRANDDSGDTYLSQLIELLGERYIFDGRRGDAASLIGAELKKRPMTVSRARVLMKLYNHLGMQQAALEVGRLAEFSMPVDRVVGFVDTQLQQMGLYKELFERIETRRASGEDLSAEDYGWFVFHAGPEALAMVGEGVKKYPDSVLLHTNYMQLLARTGRKEQAWQAYERARDLYFARLNKTDGPSLLLTGQAIEVPALPPVVQALPWYTFLLQEGKDDEFRQLDDRLRAMCSKTGTDAKTLLLPRATAEFSTGRAAAAAKSLEMCLQGKVWNEVASEAMITGALARSCRALGRRHDAIKWYRRAVEISAGDPGLLSELLCLVAEEEGAGGLQRELMPYKQRQSVDLRLNATVNCFAAWAALAKGDKNGSFENVVRAEPYFNLATHQFVGDDALVNAVIIQIVSEKLADSTRLARATTFLMRFPAERVRAIEELFRLPSEK